MEIIQKKYSREEAKSNPRNLYIFTDNGNRSSGYNQINDISVYTARYATPGNILCYPGSTSACIRGLNNAFPLCAQKTYKNGDPVWMGRWTDLDFEEFTEVISGEIGDILEAAQTGDYDRVILPLGGIFRTNIADISPTRVPRLYEWLQAETMRLAGLLSLIP